MTLVSEFAFFAKKWLKITMQKSRLLGLCNLLFMGLGQDQQQHPDVNTEEVSRGRVRGCGCWC